MELMNIHRVQFLPEKQPLGKQNPGRLFAGQNVLLYTNLSFKLEVLLKAMTSFLSQKVMAYNIFQFLSFFFQANIDVIISETKCNNPP